MSEFDVHEWVCENAYDLFMSLSPERRGAFLRSIESAHRAGLLRGAAIAREYGSQFDADGVTVAKGIATAIEAEANKEDAT
jgi:hypothetical protein